MLYPNTGDPHYREQLHLLSRSGFVELDAERTASVRTSGSDLLIYRWTDAGREACSCSGYLSPMSWALEMANGARHCVECGSDHSHSAYSPYSCSPDDAVRETYPKCVMVAQGISEDAARP